MSTTKKSVKNTKNAKTTKNIKNTKTTKTTSKSKKKSNSFINIITSTKFLTVVFFLLLILVIILGIFCYKRSVEVKNSKKSNMSVHLTKEENTSAFNINALALSSTTEYVFRVTNYSDKVNEEEINYTITISNDNDCEIEVTKNDSKKNLMTDKKQTKIEGKLSGGKKEDIYYHVKIVSKGNLDSRDLIGVNIES